MRKYGLALFILGFSMAVFAQADTTIYQTADQFPRFPGCEELDTTLAVRQQCAEQALLAFIYQNVQYPLEARLEGIEGTVVVSFVVEQDGTISDWKILRDIGGGCGAEAIRVVSAMNEVGVRWVPGKIKDTPVRLRFNLPIRFRLEEPLPYSMLGRDSVYTVLDQEAIFISETDSISSWLEKMMKIPKGYQDSCRIGDMELSLLVGPNGNVKVYDVSDYNNLGFDFQFELISAANQTSGMWKPAIYQGRPVSSLVNVGVLIEPVGAACLDVIQSYELAKQLSEEGLQLYNEGEIETGILKMSEAVDLFPDHANFRYVRGQAYLNENMYEEACIDLKHVQKILPLSVANEIVDLICK
ncbi:MAG: energy transducer TonB [Saprospiraceae bacterium]|nr:energy transducer TonB [Saprospiraceae bacterium]